MVGDDPDQQLLLPAALREWLPDDHLAYFISDVVEQFRLSEITARYERESRGGPPYHPRMMVVAAQATNQTSDKQQAVAMVEEAIDNVGAVPKEVSADAGYYSAKAVEGLYGLCVDPFVAPERTRHGTVVPPAPRGRIPSHLSARDRMRRKLQTKRGRQHYALRMQTVEPVFGQIEQGRGFRQFLLRGLEKVNGEWSLICTGHNLLELFRFGAAQPRETPTNRSAMKCPEHRRGGRHSEAYETTGPSVAAPGNNSCRRLTSPVPMARQSILRQPASQDL